jgi:hypothetical protein
MRSLPFATRASKSGTPLAEQGVISAGIQPLKMLDLEDMEISEGVRFVLNY